MAKHLLSFDLRADFACFKKPDVNGKQGTPPVHRYFTYNMLHKPALLGVFGAIVGLKGYNMKGQIPEYYEVFKDIQIGIEPLNEYHEKGNFLKTKITYTNGTGFGSEEQGGVLAIEEQTLVKPAYRCYVMLDDTIEHQATLRQRLLNCESVYLPYLGKNEFSAWWDKDSVQEYSFSEIKQLDNSYEVSSLFIKQFSVNENHEQEDKDDFNFLDMTIPKEIFIFFERLPKKFDEKLFQYELEKFSYTNVNIKAPKILNSLYFLEETEKYVQLF